jgi:hypothetical protein
MTSTRVLFRLVVGLSAAAAAMVGSHPTPAAPEASERQASPWGVSASASSFKDHAEWFPKLASAGVSTVRLFPEWRSFEPKKGTWKWDDGDKLVKAATDNKLEINAILMGSPPGAKTSHAFPMDNLDDWSAYVSAAVGRYHKQIHCWEVWNEGNGGFNDGRHTTADYAKFAAATYTAAKKADPQARVGLTVASFDAPYLNQAIRAMAKAGAPDRFDYLCIHPYEITDGLTDVDGEIPFLWMTRLLRDMLKDSAPDRAEAEIWITEVGRRIEKKKDHVVTEQDAANTLVKVYTMALAQGVARTQWFEARDPVGEEQGFGLLSRDGSPRASYEMLKTFTTLLGAAPRYQGWLALGRDSRGYGFVFQGKSADVLVAWMPAGKTDKTLSFAADVEATRSPNAAAATLKAGRSLDLTDAPVLVVGLPPELVKQARANAGKPFPWGGDYSTARVVSCQPGSADPSRGLFQTGQARTPTVTFADGSTGILVQGDINHPVSFVIHPSFGKFQTKEYYVRAAVRRVAAGNVGMNLIYEVADSQGRTPYRNAEKWFGASAEFGWQTYTWHVTDACFSKMWGYDLSLRPEQSVPFVIGKVEVSTEPFK